ncbi:MAG: hypothetical protein HON90_15200 [Halobacteriovoraceae bacterium]|jgi:hypothetical protein|nr:hypothetical protein [Halobacteriovoraceae bacterium]
MIKLVLLLLFISCNKSYEVLKKNGFFYLENISAEILRAKEVEWKVGRKKERVVSRGLRFTSTIPTINKAGKNILAKKHGIDSWLIRVSRTRRNQTQGLEYFSISLGSMTKATRDFTVNLYYHASSVSKAFRLFHCPAFNHRFKIGSFSIDKRSENITENLFVRIIERFRGKVTRLGFAPMIISGGRSLVGKYSVDIALYNSRKKQRYSKWIKSSGIININQENPISIASCSGIKEEYNPLPESKLPTIRDLEIK